jgi:hypothetical protein
MTTKTDASDATLRELRDQLAELGVRLHALADATRRWPHRSKLCFIADELEQHAGDLAEVDVT